MPSSLQSVGCCQNQTSTIPPTSSRFAQKDVEHCDGYCEAARRHIKLCASGHRPEGTRLERAEGECEVTRSLEQNPGMIHHKQSDNMMSSSSTLQQLDDKSASTSVRAGYEVSIRESLNSSLDRDADLTVSVSVFHTSDLDEGVLEADEIHGNQSFTAQQKFIKYFSRYDES